ncbi:acyltransferase [Escherichia marmotae]|nr:acyltransferase [Escherichia marmotae]
MLFSIHYLRGLAALFVVMYHYRRILNDVYVQKDLGDILFNGAFFGVDLFFMISGFVIVLSTKNDNSLISFYAKRFFKIYPVYIAVFIVWVIMQHPSTFDVELAIKSLFFIHFDYTKPAPWFGYSSINTAWTLTYEVLFYFIFSLGLLLNHKHRTIISSSITLLLFISANYYFNGFISFNPHTTIGNGETSGLIKLVGSPLMLEFIFGMITCELYLNTKRNEPYVFLKNTTKPFFIISMAFFLLSISRGDIPHGPLDIGIPCFLLLLSFVSYERHYGLKQSKILSFLGDISYPLYLVHLVVSGYMYDIKKIFPYYAELHGFSRLLFLLLTSFALAYVIHLCIEKPASKIARVALDKFKIRQA